MSTFLCISVRFLDPYSAFHGRRDAGEPEWPPSPLRLFQALVAAAASRWWGRQFKEYAHPALDWLQRQSPPLIVAPAHHIGLPVRVAVPNNDLDVVATAWAKCKEPKKQPSELKTLKTIRPTRLIVENEEPGTIHYLYPLAAEDSEFTKHRETLFAAARSISHLGWGIDMVAAHASVISEGEAAKLSGERWRPVDATSATGYRVPIGGTLQALIDKHEAFLNRLGPDGFNPVPPLSAFRTAGYRRAMDPPAKPSPVAFKLLDPENDRFAWFPATDANCVAAMTRHATAVAAKHERKEWVDDYIHGHGAAGGETMPRFSYLPLPSIERRDKRAPVVGGIRRLLLAELHEAPNSRLLWARQMLPGQFLIDEKSKLRRAMLAPLNENDRVLRQYTARSETWASVTPVVLPGCDDGKFAKAEKLFFKALRHAGYCPDALAKLEFRNVSFWPGADLALRFQRPDYLKKDHWSVYHMRLRWRQPVRGPLAIGAGRHCGLGIFAMLSD
jgi:CRISPR-associated protein Csb2